jgi:hypothetical protein
MSRPSLPGLEKKLKSVYTLISDGMSINKACEISGIDKSTFLDNADSDRYARARDACADALFQKMLDHAAAARDLPAEKVQGARLALDTEKWVIARMKPKMYGDRVALAGDDATPLSVDHRHTFPEVPLEVLYEIAKKGEASS